MTTGSQLSRRRFLRGSAGAAWLVLAGATAVGCQPTRPPARLAPVVGYVYSGSPGEGDAPLMHLRAGLQELGYTDGQNITLLTRFAEGRENTLPDLINELVQLPVAVIVLGDTRPIPVAVRATKIVPLVMMFSTDPVGLGLVESLGRPGGNLTGLASLNLPLAGKRLELLHDAVPSIRVVAMLHNPNRANAEPELKAVEAAASALGLRLEPVLATSREELDEALRRPPPPADALYALPDVLFLARTREIAEFALRHRLPGMYGAEAYVEAGGLMSYVPDRPAMYHRAAYYVDRILKGGNPAEIPIEQPTRFKLLLNKRTATTLGVEFSRDVLLSAATVID